MDLSNFTNSTTNGDYPGNEHQQIKHILKIIGEKRQKTRQNYRIASLSKILQSPIVFIEIVMRFTCLWLIRGLIVGNSNTN